jgi:REP element-mobilizing transposase RayT
MPEPLAFFITWTCYGTWLAGDIRGSVDREHNAFGTPFLPISQSRVNALRAQLKHPPVHLPPPARAVVHDTIMAHCRHRRWELPALNVRSNHVHVVVGYHGKTPEAMLGELESWCTRRLREAGLSERARPLWTEHGSTRYLWDMEDIAGAVDYVVEGQEPERFRGKKRVEP